MLYSKYYSKDAVARQRVTTQADQLETAIAKKKAAEAEIATLQEQSPKASPEPTPEKVEAEAEPEKVADAEPGSVDVDARIKELIDGKTIRELKEMASTLGLTLSGRAKEASIAREIAIKEQENGSNDSQ